MAVICRTEVEKAQKIRIEKLIRQSALAAFVSLAEVVASSPGGFTRSAGVRYPLYIDQCSCWSTMSETRGRKINFTQ